MSSAPLPTEAAPLPSARVTSARLAVHRLLPALILLVAAGVRGYALGRSSFWSDEGNTWALVQRSWAEIAAAAAADIHPPGYYWLLKLWASLWGTSEGSLRSFSALCGVLLVAATWALGSRIVAMGGESGRRVPSWLPLSAAWLAALLPFQVYYSQEARMYMLLALLAALLFLALLRLLQPAALAGGAAVRDYVAYGAAATAGLWTHYSFPIVLASAGAAWLLAWLRAEPRAAPRSRRALAAFAAANAAALLLFAPWLPTALRQISSWPQGGERIGLLDGGRLVLQTLLFGVIRTPPEPVWPWLLAAALLPLAGIFALRRNRALPALLLWLGAPVLLMAALGLFTEAFLKFLLVASTPWCLLVAATPEAAPVRWRPAAHALLATGALLLALRTLPAYFADPNARDNYKGVATWLAAADPAQDLVVLNAPGQRDVWALYDPGLPLLALPAQRPADAADVARRLEAATAGKRDVYALLWATDESDPDALVEGWLNAQLFRGAESWQGNVRLAHFLHAPELACRALPAGPGPILLAEACLPADAGAISVAAGEPLPVQLTWQAAAPAQGALAASLQLLDARGQVAAQIDGPPAATPTSAWPDDATFSDRRALLVPAGTPPGAYQLIAVLYDPATGERLRLADPPVPGLPAEAADLGAVQVTRPASPPAPALLPMATYTNAPLGPLRLLGYTQHRAGYAHAPATPVAAGDRLHLTLFWQAPDPLPADWPADLTFTLALGGQSVTLPLAGGAYPTGQWQPGEVVRTEVEIGVDASGLRRRPTLHVADDTLRLARLPHTR